MVLTTDRLREHEPRGFPERVLRFRLYEGLRVKVQAVVSNVFFYSVFITGFVQCPYLSVYVVLSSRNLIFVLLLCYFYSG